MKNKPKDIQLDKAFHIWGSSTEPSKWFHSGYSSISNLDVYYKILLELLWALKLKHGLSKYSLTETETSAYTQTKIQQS